MKRPKIIRYACYFLYAALFRFTPEIYRPYSLFFPAIRRLLVLIFAERCGRNLRVKHNADISPHIEIGDDSELGQNCVIYGGVTLGSNVLMGPGVRIITRNHRFSDPSIPIRIQGETFAPVKIGDDVWLGANVVILPGVEIGAHAIVGAGAIVTRSIPAWAIAGGNPAKVIKFRDYGESGS